MAASRWIVKTACCSVIFVSTVLAQESKQPAPRRIPVSKSPASADIPPSSEAAEALLRAFDDSEMRHESICNEVKAHWRVIKEHEEYELNMDVGCAQRIVDELWHDWGSAPVNYEYQQRLCTTLATVAFYARRARRSDIQAIIRNGLVEYCRSGGMAIAKPSTVSWAFYCSDGYEDPEIRQLVVELGDPGGFLEKLESAGRFDAGDDEVAGDAAMLEQIDRPAFEEQRDATGQPASGGDDDTIDVGSSTAREAARKLLSELRQFMRTGARDVAELDRIADCAARGYGDDSVDSAVVKRLLLTYRRILQRKQRPDDEPVVRVIDRDLVRMGRRRELAVEVQFFWARAVEAMGRRASSELQSVLQERAKTAEDLRVVYALRHAIEKLEAAHEP